ncbi:MAG: hypothetical protein WAW82_07955 [Candidatus Lutibacillus vidarii]
MTNIGFALSGAWRVLLVGLVLGAGLPAVFALGIRAAASGVGGDAEVSRSRAHPLGRLLAVLCFGLVLAGVVVGITYVVASGLGKTISFEHIYPVIVPKS